MIRKIALGAAALSLSLGGAFAAAGTASAATVKPDATKVTCTNVKGSAGFSPAIPLTGSVKVSTISFTGSSTSCSAIGAVGTAVGVNKVVLTGSAKSKNASLANFAAPTAPTVIKATLSFYKGATLICTNKAKLATGSPVVGPPLSYPVSSAFPGGKGLGGKCFKGKKVAVTAVLDKTLAQILSAPLSNLAYTGVNGPTTLTVG